MSHFESYFTVGTYVFSFLIGGMVIFLANFKKIISKFKELQVPQIEQNFIRIHSQIDELLTELRLKLECCRTGIVKFHNGGHFFDGTSILKFTTTHESCELGVVSSMDSPQGQLITRYMDKIKLLEKNNTEIYYTTDLKDSYFKGYLEARGAISFCIVPLECEKGMKMGYVLIEWCDYEKIENIDTDSLKGLIRYYSRMINTILINRKQCQT